MKCTKNFKETQNLTSHLIELPKKNTTYIDHDSKNVIGNTSPQGWGDFSFSLNSSLMMLDKNFVTSSTNSKMFELKVK